MGSTKVEQPAAPTPPTATQTATDYASALPIYYQSALQYEPKIAQMEKSIQEQLYPETSGLQEQLAGIASKGISEDAPAWYAQQMSDQLKSQFGRNAVFNPLGQQAYGTGYQQGLQNWQQYYQNLGLSLAGRQPLTQPSNMMQSYTPASNMNMASNTYGTQANVYGTQSSNWQNQPSNPWMNIAGSLAGGIGSGVGTGLGYGFMKKMG